MHRLVLALIVFTLDMAVELPVASAGDERRASAVGSGVPTHTAPVTIEDFRHLDPPPAPASVLSGREPAPQLGRRSEPAAFVGGDDLIVDAFPPGRFASMEVLAAGNGDLYARSRNATSDGSLDDDVFLRSTDDGESWRTIGRIQTIDPEYRGFLRFFVVDEAPSRVFALYRARDDTTFDWEIRVAYADVGVASPTWTIRTVMNQPDVIFIASDMTDDSRQFPDYWLYVVAAGRDADGDDIWFSRSTDHGETWSTPFRVVSYATAPADAEGSSGFRRPRIDYGGSGRLHLAAQFEEDSSGPGDIGISYRRGVGYGDSASDWSSPLWSLTSPSNGFDEKLRGVVTDPDGSGVSVLLTEENVVAVPQVFRSLDAGVSWSVDDITLLPAFTGVGDIGWDPAGEALYVSGSALSPLVNTLRASYVRAPASDPTDFSEPQHMGDHVAQVGEDVLVDFHPTREPSLMMGYVGVRSNDPDPIDVVNAFDGLWRGGPGFPNYEPGFPRTVAGGGTRERTSPALSDVDGDGQLEIVFANVGGLVYVVEPDGSTADGWPVDVGTIGDPDAPVAVGDLNGDGEPSIVVGTQDGRVHALAPDGSMRDGFPVDLGTGATTYVALGALQQFYPRWIVAVSGRQTARVNWRGDVEFKSGTLAGTHDSPPAIGDVDGDGRAEIVFSFSLDAGGTGVQVLEGDFTGGVQASRTFFDVDPSAPVSLGDLDRDDDLEITVPQSGGTLQVLHHDMTDVAGFPYTNPDAGSLSPVAIDQILGTAEPELIFNGTLGYVHVVYADGIDQSAFPARTSIVWFLYGGSIATTVDVASPNSVVVGSRDQKIWSFRNVGAVQAEGWPRDVDDQIETTPAAGDIDGDGRNEIVFLGNEQLHVFDVNVPDGGSDAWWPMEGANAERTGCGGCVEDRVTSVDPQPVVAGPRLRLASGNPVRGTADFAFSLASRARVELQVFDLRGRLVRDVAERELDAGEHRILFDGRDDRGQRLARGTYLARLVVDGATRSHGTRKFVFMD